MVEVNRLTTSATMHWRFLDRTTGADNPAIDWRFTVGDRVKIRLVNEMASDHPMHHPFHLHGAGRFLVLARDGVAEPNLVWKDTVLVRTGSDRGHPVRRHQPGPVDGPLPHRRAHAKRHDVQLQRGPPLSGASADDQHGRTMRERGSASPDRLLDAVVIGGGQAGLAIAWHLKRQGLRFVVLEAGPRAGPHLASPLGLAKLFTPAQYDAPARHAVPGSGRHLPDQGSGGRLPPGLCDRLRPAGPAQRPGDQPYPDRRGLRGPYRRRHAPGPAGGGGHRPVPGALRSAGRRRAGRRR